ncbi:MAG TPA: transposase [Syntrophobacteraceae bacterium]|nr:transposase [Syntrophobacteraceae bacterium]
MQDIPTRKRIRLSNSAYGQGHAFSITIATDGRYPWFRLYKRLSAKLVELLLDLAKTRKTILYAWCIMPDHIHMLAQDKDVVELVRLLKGRLIPAARRLEPGRVLWQRSFYDHALREVESLPAVALYIWQNPVRAGIIDSACAYPWSGSLVWPDWKATLAADGRAGINPAPTQPCT